MPVLPSRKRQAHVAVTLAVAAVTLPSAVQALSGSRVGSREIVQVEFAGSGERLMALAQSRRERLQTYRSLLGLRDNAYVAVYSAPLLLGVDLLPGKARHIGLLLALGTAAADVAENVALEDALGILLADPSQPALADLGARRARRAASVKFALLGPAIGMALWGVARAWRPPSDRAGEGEST